MSRDVPAPVFARWALLVLVVATGPGCTDYRLGANPGDDTGGGDSDTTAADDDVTPLPDAETDCNGEDDDGDGLVDEGHPDADGDGIADCVDGGCELDLPAAGAVEPLANCEGDFSICDPWSVAIEWQWTGVSYDPDISWSGHPPLVGRLEDTDGDGAPGVADLPVVVTLVGRIPNFEQAALVALRGDGTTLWEHPSGEDGLVFIPTSSIAVGDVDGDGWADVVAFVECPATITPPQSTTTTPPHGDGV